MRPLRFALIVLGLSLAVYGTSTLTGGWLGTPPWWERRIPEAEWGAEYERIRQPGAVRDTRGEYIGPDRWEFPSAIFRARRGREWISGAVIAGGVGFVFAAWAWRTWRPGKIS